MIADFRLFLKAVLISVIVFLLVVFALTCFAMRRSRLKELAICSFSVTGVFSSFIMLTFVLFPSVSEIFTKTASLEAITFIRQALKTAFDAESFFAFVNMTSAFSVFLFSLASCALTVFVISCALVSFLGAGVFVFAEKYKDCFSRAAGIAERKLFYKFSKNLN